MELQTPIYAILHHPRMLSSHSGMDALADAVGAKKIYYDITWEHVQRKSWTLGQWLRHFGNRWYQSQWNALVPGLDEWRIRRILKTETSIVHFLWAEFAHPRSGKAYHRKGAKLVGTFHASARKQPSVIRHRSVFEVFDAITLMSSSQKPFFLELGLSEARMRVILHGVDTVFFAPASELRGEDGQPIRALLVGKTERDHEFAAEVIRKVPRGLVEFTVCTSPEHATLYYRNVPHVRLVPWLSDEGLREAYQKADLLFMPVHDCAANNAVLEAMACGTPVMANRVGGIPEYVPEEAGVLMAGKKADEWIDMLQVFHKQRGLLRKKGEAARRWAETLAWEKIAASYVELYREVLER